MGAKTNRVAFGFLAALGAIIWLIAIALHVAGFFTGHTYEIDHTVLLVGGIFGFVGFFGLDSKRAKEGAGVIIDGSVQILRALPRFGRRSTDAVAIPGAETTITAAPVPSAPEPAPEDHGKAP